MSAHRSPRVPAWARALLWVVLPRGDRPFALADLEEEYEERARLDGERSARRWYRAQAVRSAIPALMGRMRRRGREGFRARFTGRMGGGGGGMSIQSLAEHVSFAVRTLSRAPTTVLITVLSLGLGIGAVTTVFAVAEGVLNPAAPGLRDPERLVTVYTSEDDGERYGVSSYPDYESVRDAPALAAAAASAVRLISLEEGAESEALLAEAVTGNYFDVTGIRPVLGRGFLPEEGRVGAGAPVAVLGHEIWRERFGGDPGVVGRAIRLNGHPTTVVGVAPEGVTSRRVPVRPDAWVPLASPADPGRRDRLERRDDRDYLIVGRLATAAGIEELTAQLDGVSARLADAFPEAWTDDVGNVRAFTAVSERKSRVNPGARLALGAVALFFFVPTGLVLLIACTNVTSLFLVRASRRRREIAIRTALGAGRRQIVSLLLAEGLLLGVAAGAVGMAFSEVLANVLASFSLPINIPIRVDFRPSGVAYGFGFLVALATSLVFSLVPAVRVSKSDLALGLRAGGTRTVSGRRRFGPGSALVSVQFAAALVLVVGAGLFIRSLKGAAEVDLGIDPTGIALMSRTVPEDVGWEAMPAFYRDLEARLDRVPGATHAALSRGLELTLLQVSAAVSLGAVSRERSEEGVAGFRNSVTPGYLEMLGVPLVRGRTIAVEDAAGGTPVAVVNETLARRLWPGEDPMGRTFTLLDRRLGPRSEANGPLTLQVVGVVADGVYLDVGDPPTPYVWTSLYQDPSRTIAVTLKGVRADAMVRELRERVSLAPGEVPILPPTTYESQLSLQTIHLRIASRVLGWGGAFGLFLAVIGVYGLVSFTVSERTREIAIRRAVGADAARVVRSIVRQGVRLAGVGLAVGVALVLPGARVIRGVLVGVGPADPVSLGGSLLLLLGAAAVASFLPARRASRIDPMEVLRED